ncbi:MAG TPA: hypothetical protein DGD08_06305 [Gemmatimonas aurantiaca]|uniref:Outer membrane protein beta-barrel domain-containing protein n=2 Tax=Gemmatimonas aurantiaca TaxID=173480 RepID=C1A725_GEMAT|nr:hypothetical protein [Gemmatimonas aurantiaca]BAH38035.1 hypothetical protein GAU_0993 [Gemmatimonas aurantiaca T-27]HCT56809.1 hypothetical protein [Gemmatimonas aurantiaca]
MTYSISFLISRARRGLSTACTCAAVACSIGTPVALWAQSAAPVALPNQSATINVVAAPTRTIDTKDSITSVQPPRPSTALFRNSGFYLSLGGGTSLPSLELKDRGYEPGFNVQVPIGFHRPNQLLGVRLDLGYNRLGSDRRVVARNASGQGLAIPANRPQIYSATLNMTARGQLGAFGIYGVGGAGMYQFRSFGTNSPIDQAIGDGETPVVEFNNANRIRQNAFGAQLGGGMEFGIGGAALFVESRFVNVFGNTKDYLDRDQGIGNRNAIRWVPIAVGVTLR